MLTLEKHVWYLMFTVEKTHLTFYSVDFICGFVGFIYLITGKYLFLVGLFSIAICSHIFRKSDEFCPNEQIKYITILLAPSLVSWAVYCDVDKARCSRYVYNNLPKKCMLYNGLLGIQNNWRTKLIYQLT
jgi:hypothetical protein